MWLRKGLDVVVEAFEKAGVDAELHIKVPLERFVPQRTWPSNIVVHTSIKRRCVRISIWSREVLFT